MYDEWGIGQFECLSLKVKTGLPTTYAFMGRKVDLNVTLGDSLHTVMLASSWLGARLHEAQAPAGLT